MKKFLALVLAIAQAVAIVISFEGVLKESTLGDGFILPTWMVGVFDNLAVFKLNSYNLSKHAGLVFAQ